MKLHRLFQHWENTRAFDAGAVIFSEKEPAGEMYVILDGEVQLSIRGEPLATESVDGIIGEMAILDAPAHSATAAAITPVTLARLDRDQFRGFIRENPDFSLHAMAVLAGRLRTVDEFITARLE